jgi:hypothetical protein
MSDMWSAIRWLVLRIAMVRWLFKLGWLGLLIPVVLILKTIGLPILAVLSIVAIPIVLLLLLFGLPILLVFIFGSLFMGFLGLVLTIGVAALKIGLFVVLPIWLIWTLGRKVYWWSCKRDNGDSSSDTQPGSSAPGGPTPEPSSDDSDEF